MEDSFIKYCIPNAGPLRLSPSPRLFEGPDQVPLNPSTFRLLLIMRCVFSPLPAPQRARSKRPKGEGHALNFCSIPWGSASLGLSTQFSVKHKLHVVVKVFCECDYIYNQLPVRKGIILNNLGKLRPNSWEALWAELRFPPSAPIQFQTC